MAKKALLIGIDYANMDVELNGCINDIINMRNVLIDAYDYEPANITMLRDDIDDKKIKPTGANIFFELQKIISESSKLEEIWIHYSGHGSQIKDINGDEPSKMDSVIVPLDYLSKGVIVDDAIFSIIKNVKCKCVLIFDSCNSGTICDLPYSFINKSGGSYGTIINNNYKVANPNIFCFSSCRDTQTSSDAFSSASEQYVGAFTFAFIETLRKNKHNIHYLQLYQETCNLLVTNGFTQIPVFSSSGKSPTEYMIRALPVITASQSAQLDAATKASFRNFLSRLS